MSYPSFDTEDSSMEVDVNPIDFKIPAICLTEAVRAGEAHPGFQEAIRFLQQSGRYTPLDLQQLQKTLNPRDMMSMLISAKRGIQTPDSFLPPYPGVFWEAEERDYFDFIDTVVEDTTGGDLHFFLTAVVLRELDGREVLEPTMSGRSMEFHLADFLKRDVSTVLRLRTTLQDGSTLTVEEMVRDRFRYFLGNVAEYVVHSYCPDRFLSRYGGPEEIYAHLLNRDINLPGHLEHWADMWANTCAGIRVRDLLYDAPCPREPFLIAYKNQNGITEVRTYDDIRSLLLDTRKTIPGFGFLRIDVGKQLSGESGMDEQFLPGDPELRRSLRQTGTEALENARFYGTDIFVDEDNRMNWYLPGFSEFQAVMEAWSRRYPDITTYTVLDLLQTAPGSIPPDVEMALGGLLENTGFAGAMTHEEVLFLERYYENDEVVLPESMAGKDTGVNFDAFFRLGFTLVERSTTGNIVFEDAQSREKLILEERQEYNIYVLRPQQEISGTQAQADGIFIPEPVSTLLH
ncbi:MAG TPA: hypothetical protein VJ934_08900 [Desulfomicrobiaceae bacterium]|nr:hypothetical protein [Desulfomicrobiaceae bacterium]